MDAVKGKNDRLSVRLNADQKMLLDQAAQAVGVSTSGFVLSYALEAANTIIGQQHRIELSERDWSRFLEIIQSDEEPTPAAVEAAKRYKGQ
jgi:uncharacterized protein (DUF1778 family)